MYGGKPQRWSRADTDALIDALTVHPSFEGYHPAFLIQLIDARMRDLGIGHWQAYQTLLRADASEPRALAALLPVVHTCFFRDQLLWLHLARRTIPQLLARCASNANIRVWNPGCATGQELHALALLLAEQCAPEQLSRLQLIGTDLSPRAIALAKTHSFTAEALEHVPPYLRAKYFSCRDGLFTLDERLARTMTFVCRDLLRDEPYSRLDMIVCRNTLIYFTPEVRRRLLAAFHFVLRDGGHLVLGSCERTYDADRAEFACESADLGVYRKLPARGVHPWVRFGCSVLSRLPSAPQPRPTG